jgi:hypothetical protein
MFLGEGVESGDCCVDVDSVFLGVGVDGGAVWCIALLVY